MYTYLHGKKSVIGFSALGGTKNFERNKRFAGLELIWWTHVVGSRYDERERRNGEAVAG